MTFEEVLNNRPTAYDYSRKKWNLLSDVDAFVASLKEAHEQELNALRESYLAKIADMELAHTRKTDRALEDRLQRDCQMVNIAEQASNLLKHLVAVVDPRGEVKRLLRQEQEENTCHLMQELLNGSIGNCFTREEIKDMIESMAPRKEDA